MKTEANINLLAAMRARYPWVVTLSREDQEDCARETLEALRVRLSRGNVHRVHTTIISWRETAEALAAGLGDTSVEWLDEPEFVERP